MFRTWRTIECERGFSAQNKIKTPGNRKIFLVARLALLMQLSLSYRKQCVDLTNRLGILREAAVIFSTMPLQGASNEHSGTNAQDISFWAAMIALCHSL